MRAVFIAAIIILILSLMFFGSEAVNYAVHGLELFSRSVFPALFPFFVCINCLKKCGCFNGRGESGLALKLLRLFAVCSISGTPSGSLLVSESFFEDKRAGIDAPLLTMLSACLNLSGPAFIIGVIGVKLIELGSIRDIMPVFVAHYGASALIIAVLFFIITKRRKRSKAQKTSFMQSDSDSALFARAKPAAQPISVILPSAIVSALTTLVKIGGTIVFFVVICGMIEKAGLLRALHPAVESGVFGLIEMTNGIARLAACAIPLRLKLSIISFLVSFGGVCIFMQAASVAKTLTVEYFIAKLVHGFLAFFICYAIYPAFFDAASPVFSDTGARIAGRVIAMSEIGLLFLLSSLTAALISVFAAGRTRA